MFLDSALRGKATKRTLLVVEKKKADLRNIGFLSEDSSGVNFQQGIYDIMVGRLS